jgi:hypothetical protein
VTKKKKTPPIEGTGRKPEELLVQKSRPLFALWQSDLTLQEFKILDTYLARIDSHQPDKRTVVFEKGELEQLLGVSKINLPQLKDRLKHLMGNVVEVGNPKQPKSMHLITLFEEAAATQDETTGLWEVHLECTRKAMKYCFNIDKIGYLRYKLRGIVSLQSRYSYVLFLYLESNRRYKTWTVDLNELKAILKCDKEETYKEYKRFNDLILKRCSKEILEKTEQRFIYEPIKKGRKVIAIKFTLETLADAIEPAIPGQLCLDDFADDAEQDLFAGSLPEGLTEEQVEALKALAAPKIKHDPSGLHPWECALADYLRQKTLLMQAHNRKVKHPFSYLKTMIEKDPDA